MNIRGRNGQINKRGGEGTQKKLEKRHKKRRGGEKGGREAEEGGGSAEEMEDWGSAGSSMVLPLICLLWGAPCAWCCYWRPGTVFPGAPRWQQGHRQECHKGCTSRQTTCQFQQKKIPGLSSLTRHASVSIFQPLKAQLGPWPWPWPCTPLAYKRQDSCLSLSSLL